MREHKKTAISEELAILKNNILKDTPPKNCDNSANSVLSHSNETNETEPENEDVFAPGMRQMQESVLVTYSLTGKSRSKKMLFNYALIGRNGKDGVLQKMSGKKVASGCVIIPASREAEISEFLKKHEVGFEKLRITLHEQIERQTTAI